MTVVLCRLGRQGSDRDGVTLGLEAVLVGHPVDGDGLAVGGLEAVGSLHHDADLVVDLLGLALRLHCDGVAGLEGVLEGAVLVLSAIQPEKFRRLGVLGPSHRRRHAQAQDHLKT